MKRLLLFLAFLFTPLIGYAQGFNYQDFTVGPTGFPAAGATVSVCNQIGSGPSPCPSNMPTAMLYTDATLGVQKMNPFTADAHGNFTFSVASAGNYIVTVTGPQVTTYSYAVTIGGGGGSCPGGPDTSVQTAHPAGACFGSAKFTWDATNQNLQILTTGTPNTQNPGLTDSVIMGGGNTAGNALLWLFGLNNTAPYCSICVITGSGNSTTNSPGVGDDYLLGEFNSVTAGTGSSSVVNQTQMIGRANSITAGSAGDVDTSTLFGYANSLTSGSASIISNNYIFGGQNTVNAGDAGMDNGGGLFVVGGQNHISITADGEFGNTAILGDANTVSMGTGDISLLTIAGHNNTATGDFGNAAMFGNSLSLNTCNDCYLYGENSTLSADSTIGIGLSSTPELEITPGSAKITYLAGSGTQCVHVSNTGAITGTGGDCASGGSVTSIATTAPITGGTITTTGTIGCATCVAASSPGAGIAHFAGSTQTVTSSAVNLAADVTGQLPIAAVGSAGLSGTSPVAIASTGVISCATCVSTGANATFGAHVYDFTSATSLTIPTSAGATTAANGQLAFDTTNHNFHGWNGADSIFGIFDATAITNGDCVQITKTGSKVQLTDAGGACGMGSSSAFSSLTNGTNTTAAMHVGTGASLDATGSGTIAATTAATASAVPFSGVTAATNTTAAMVVGTGASLAATGSGTITATATPFSGLTSATNTTAAMLVGSGASLGPTGTGAITATLFPVGSGAVTTANGQQKYDTANLNWHIWDNAADRLMGVWSSFPPTNGDCVQAGVSAGSVTLVDSGTPCGSGGSGLPSTGSTGIVVQTAPTTTVARTLAATGPLSVTNANGTAGNPTVACATCTTGTTTDTFTNKTLNQEGSGNVVTTVWSAYADAAACNVSSAGTDWDLIGTAIPTANCLTGSNTQQGTLDYADSMNEFGQFKLALPTNWTGNVDVLLYWTVTSGGGSNAVNLTIASACTAPGASYDTSFNAPQSVTTNVPANGVTTTSQQSAITTTGCSGGNLMHLKIGRDTTDTFTGTARIIGARVTGRKTGA